MAGGSKFAVFAAIGANTCVAIAKLIGFGLTGSGAMLSEGIHSIADVGNQALLAVGLKRSSRPADATHPFGYGREGFVWALISAVGIFFLGCGVTVMHGVHTLASGAHHEMDAPGTGTAILVFSLVIEGISFGIAIRGLFAEARSRGIGFWTNLRTTEDPFGVAVFLEDLAAVVGVLIALGAISMARLTHDHRWDAYGSIAVGALLGLVALFLVHKNRAFLIGKAIRAEDQHKLGALLTSDPAVERVIQQRSVITGVADFRISAEIDFDGAYLARRYLESHDARSLLDQLETPEALSSFLAEYSENVLDLMGSEIDRIEARIRSELPNAKNIALEPD